MPHRNALNLDSNHNTAIRAEIGERLRVLLSKEHTPLKRSNGERHSCEKERPQPGKLRPLGDLACHLTYAGAARHNLLNGLNQGLFHTGAVVRFHGDAD